MEWRGVGAVDLALDLLTFHWAVWSCIGLIEHPLDSSNPRWGFRPCFWCFILALAWERIRWRWLEGGGDVACLRGV